MKISQKWKQEKLDNPGFTNIEKKREAYRICSPKRKKKGKERKKKTRKWRKYNKIPRRNIGTFLYIQKDSERNSDVLYVNRQNLSEKKNLLDRQIEYLVNRVN